MRLLVQDVWQLFDYAESYFRTNTAPCRDYQGPRYAYQGRRCVIGDMILTETEYELYWLSQFRGVAPGILAGLFSIHPNTRLSQAAWQIQQLHDAQTNWIEGAGFTAWDEFFQIKGEFI